MTTPMIYSSLIAVVLLTLGIDSHNAKLQKFKNEKNTHIISNDSPVGNFIARTRQECASLCTTDDNCYSANFELVTGQCHFYTTFYPNTEAFVGSETIKKTSITGVASGFCDIAIGYTYDADMNICYKAFIQKQIHANAKATCDGDDARLLLINSLQVYQWTIDLMASNAMSRIYIQGERVNEVSPFLDDEGNELTYFNWVKEGPGSGTYLRTDGTTKLMEASSGTGAYNFICQIY
ncbi:unnamed protein product [Mytilus coruscus]|uniref:Apple domain-containing protein n=1 Tax=Mytilus coruscus TaxID=42192 RepID=A0A6J8BTN3_MYTCO|nr:unnamed protein product [Mytilus coruscus]